MWHPSCTSVRGNKRKRNGARRDTGRPLQRGGERERGRRGVRYTWPGTTRPISPVRPNSARAQNPSPPFSLAPSPRFVQRPSVAAVYGRHYLDRDPGLGLNDLFVCTGPLLSGVDFREPAKDSFEDSSRYLPTFFSDTFLTKFLSTRGSID